jgi:hypothetical protein
MAKATPTTVDPKPYEVNVDCKKKREEPELNKRTGKPKEPWTRCMCQQLCAAIAIMEEKRNLPPEKGGLKPVPRARETADYGTYKGHYIKSFMDKVAKEENVDNEFVHPCAACEYKQMPKGTNPTEGGKEAPFNAGHTHEAAWGGDLKDLSQFKMMNRRVNGTIKFQRYKPEGEHKDQPIQAKDSCNCPDGPEPNDESGCSLKAEPGEHFDIGGEG